MTRYHVETTVRVSGLDTEALFDPLAEAVYELADVIDADLGARIDAREFDFTMEVDADDPPSALTAGLAAVRCALHAVGSPTAGWDDHFAAIRHIVSSDPVAA